MRTASRSTEPARPKPGTPAPPAPPRGGERDPGAGAARVRGPAAEETDGGRVAAGVPARDAGPLGPAREARRPAGDQRARRDVLPRDAPPAAALGDAQGRRLLERRAP